MGRLLDEILHRLAPAASSDRMPPRRSLSPAEQRELEAYFGVFAVALVAGQNAGLKPLPRHVGA